MSGNITNRTIQLHRDNLNPFALWDCAYLAREANSQAQFITYYETLAKIAWVAFMIFSMVFTTSFGSLNAYSLPAALYALIQVYQPYMEATYHSWKIEAESGRDKHRMYTGILSAYQKLQLLSESALSNEVESLKKSPPTKNPELYLPILSQYIYFSEKMKEKEVQLQKLADEILHDEAVRAPDEFLYLRRVIHFELEERLCIQKVEVAYLIHVVNHPFDKNRLTAFGQFQQMKFSHFCSWKLFHPDSSPTFFRCLTKPSLTREQVRNLSPDELHERIF